MKHISASRHFATVVASLLLALSAACTTMMPVTADATGERIRAEVQAGDTVRVLLADGTTHTLKVSAVGESSLTGNASHGGSDAVGSRIELPYRDIRQVDVQRVSSGKTTGIVLLVVAVAALAIASGGGSHTPGYTR